MEQSVSDFISVFGTGECSLFLFFLNWGGAGVLGWCVCVLLKFSEINLLYSSNEKNNFTAVLKCVIG